MGMTDVSRPARPTVFALSNPKTKAEVTAYDAYTWSKGAAIYGSGTAFDPVQIEGKNRTPGQVNNVYIFPGVSFGAICCEAKSIPERFFMVAAEAVANSLDKEDMRTGRVVPHPDRIREVGLNVATAIVLEAQKLGIARREIGKGRIEVEAALRDMMWSPSPSQAPANLTKDQNIDTRRPSVSVAAAAAHAPK